MIFTVSRIAIAPAAERMFPLPSIVIWQLPVDSADERPSAILSENLAPKEFRRMMMNRRQSSQARPLEFGPIEDARGVYEDALATYRGAQADVDRMAQELGGAAEALRSDPLRVAPLDRGAADAGIPLHVTTGPFRRELPMGEWPDAQHFMTRLGSLHQAHTRVRALHAWLLPADRAVVEAP